MGVPGGATQGLLLSAMPSLGPVGLYRHACCHASHAHAIAQAVSRLCCILCNIILTCLLLQTLTNNLQTGGLGAMKVVKSAAHYTEAARDEITLLSQITERDPGKSRPCQAASSCRLCGGVGHADAGAALAMQLAVEA